MRYLETDRLSRAVATAIAASSSCDALRMTDSRSSNRGSSVQVANDRLAISFVMDWLEGELDVALGAVGGTKLDLADVADRSSVKVLSLTRLRKGVTVDMLSRRVGQILELVERTMPGFLLGTESAVAFVTSRSA